MHISDCALKVWILYSIQIGRGTFHNKKKKILWHCKIYRFPRSLLWIQAGKNKHDLLMSFDEILGLKLGQKIKKGVIAENVRKLAKERDILRNKGEFEKADEIRNEIIRLGYALADKSGKTMIKKL